MPPEKRDGICYVEKVVERINLVAAFYDTFRTRGVLNKPLTVIADDFSADAVKMILLTGGKAMLS